MNNIMFASMLHASPLSLRFSYHSGTENEIKYSLYYLYLKDNVLLIHVKCNCNFLGSPPYVETFQRLAFLSYIVWICATFASKLLNCYLSNNVLILYWMEGGSCPFKQWRAFSWNVCMYYHSSRPADPWGQGGTPTPKILTELKARPVSPDL